LIARRCLLSANRPAAVKNQAYRRKQAKVNFKPGHSSVAAYQPLAYQSGKDVFNSAGSRDWVRMNKG